MNSTTVISMYYCQNMKHSYFYGGPQLEIWGEGLLPLADILLALILQTIW